MHYLICLASLLLETAGWAADLKTLYPHNFPLPCHNLIRTVVDVRHKGSTFTMSAPSGIPLVVQVSRDVVTVRNLETGETNELGHWADFRIPGSKRISAAALSPNGHWLAIGRADKHQIEVRAPMTEVDAPPQYVANLQIPELSKAEIRGIEFSPDGQHLAAVSYSGTGELFKLGKRKLSSQVSFEMTDGKISKIRTLEFSPDSQWLATLSAGGVLQLIEVVRKQHRIFPLSNAAETPTDRAHHIAFTGDSKTLMVNTRSGLKLWNVEKGKWREKQFAGLAFGFEIADYWILLGNSAESNAVFAYHTPSGEMREIVPHNQFTVLLPEGVAQFIGQKTTFSLVPPRAFASGMDGRYLLMGDAMGAVRVFETQTFREVVSFQAFPFDDSPLHPGTVLDRLWAGDAKGTFFYVLADDKVVHVPVPLNVNSPDYQDSIEFREYQKAQTSDQSHVQWVRRFNLHAFLAPQRAHNPQLN